MGLKSKHGEALTMNKIVLLATKIKEDIFEGENLDNYAAILLGFALTILSIFGELPDEWLINFLSLTLTLLLINNLKNTYLLQEAKKLFLGFKLHETSQLLKDRTEYEPLEKRLNNAKEAIVIGDALLGFIGFNKDIIRKFAQQGCDFKFIIVNPKLLSDDEAPISDDVKKSLSLIVNLSQDCPGKFQVRFSKRRLPVAIFAVDINNSNKGLIQVQLHPLHEESALRGHFDLSAEHKSQWYQYYKEQIENLWKQSSPYNHSSISL